MKQKFIAKVFVVFMAFMMLFSLCSFTVAAATDNVAVAKATTQTTKAKRLTYTETLKAVNERLEVIEENTAPKEPNFWKDGVKELKKFKWLTDLVG